MPRLTVWYNTLCPVCDAGIRGQKRRLVDLVKSKQVEFRDINLEPDALADFGVGVNDVRRRLHATDQDGNLITGADVAIALWRITPGQHWLATLLGNRAMLPLTRWSYDRFAGILYAWNQRKGRW
ncbi:thiol-disulfide oxidoreductase DCC family protein [Aestuariivirga sp.]|uniref:thiol-disulfide oxidoreductase DCC family protein n=1 Tax=Aestuariivirga sp. TaxID=2650926 RepID=UPI0039E3EA8B